MVIRMKFAAFFILICHSLLIGNAIAHTVTFHVHNKCPFPIWPATASNVGQPVIADGGFYLPPGQTERIIAPWTWSGRIWARTGCKFAASCKQACETGDCGGLLACRGLIGTPPVTLVQFSLQGDNGKPNYYDVSIVDGYNLPVSVSSIPFSPGCSIFGCRYNPNRVCPRELQVVNQRGEIVACKSACLAFDKDKFCCRNAYGSPETCKPNFYSKMFKDACPNYYSYAYDSPPPLVSSPSKEYAITFCPGGWGENTDSM